MSGKRGASGGRSRGGGSSSRSGSSRKGSGRSRKKAPVKRGKGTPERSVGVRVLRWVLFLTALAMMLAGATLVGGYWYFSQGLPDFERLEDWRPPQVTRIRAADGTVIAEVYRERRTMVTRAQLPEVLVQAVLSAEDADFWEHEGLDYQGMLRALINAVQAGRIVGSGSTITQQTVKNLLLTHEQTFERKARELILARRIEQRLSKDDILTMYLNALYLGHGRYGVAEAARFYFGHDDLSDITLPQAATLAGLIQSPERLSPRKHPERSLERRRFTLRMMHKNGYITAEQVEAASEADLALAEVPEAFVPEAQWFADLVRAELIAKLGEERVTEGGLEVRTSLDLKRQRAGLTALREALVALDRRQGYGKPRAKVPNGEAAGWRAKRAKALKQKPPTPGRAVDARVIEIEADALVVELGVGEATVDRDAIERFADPENKTASPYGVGDVIRVSVRADGPTHPERMKAVPAAAPQGALVVIDPMSRHVLALVGGWSHGAYPFDRATQAKRQPGSAFKPFVYGAAIESKRYTAASVVVDAPETLRVHAGKYWQPKNYSGKFDGVLTLRTALMKSVNSIAVSMATDIGVPAVQDFARRAGIRSALADGPAMALGASEVHPIELANAYATIAAGGQYRPPQFIVAIEGPDGPIEVEVPEAEQVIDPAVAWVLRDMMRSVVTSGTATALAKFERPVVGKTGTTNEARDTWFVGALPEVVAAAYIGFDTPRSLGRRETGGKTALPVVKRYLEAVEGEGPDWPDAPEGVVSRQVVEDGRLAAPGTEDGRVEFFLAGTAPTEVAPAAGQVDADSFMREQLGGALGGPAVAVPSVGVSPLPPTLKPIAPASAKPVEGGDAPRLRPIAPAGSGDDEDLPP